MTQLCSMLVAIGASSNAEVLLEGFLYDVYSHICERNIAFVEGIPSTTPIFTQQCSILVAIGTSIIEVLLQNFL